MRRYRSRFVSLSFALRAFGRWSNYRRALAVCFEHGKLIPHMFVRHDVFDVGLLAPLYRENWTSVHVDGEDRQGKLIVHFCEWQLNVIVLALVAVGEDVTEERDILRLQIAASS